MYTPSFREENGKAVGFTLLELLIVIGIMVILGTVLILVLNPAETLKKSRDNQRISDLATVKTALGLYITDVASPDLDAAVVACSATSLGAVALISYSKPLTDAACITPPAVGADMAPATYHATDWCRYVASPNAGVDGAGWIPVDLTGISGGTPLASYPLDPTNTVATNTAPASTDLVYRYACQNATTSSGKPSFVFELDAQLESTAYTVTSDKRTQDGGDNTNYYEVGNSVKLLPTSAAF